MSSGFARKRIPPLFRLVLVQAASISPKFTMINSTFYTSLHSAYSLK